MPGFPNKYNRGGDAQAWFDRFGKDLLFKGAAFNEPTREPLSQASIKGRSNALLFGYGFHDAISIPANTYMPEYQRAFQQERIDFHARADLTNRKDF